MRPRHEVAPEVQAGIVELIAQQCSPAGQLLGEAGEELLEGRHAAAQQRVEVAALGDAAPRPVRFGGEGVPVHDSHVPVGTASPPERNAVIDEYRRAARAREYPVAEPNDTATVDPDDDAVLAEPAHCMRPLLAGCRLSSAAPSN